MLNVFSNYLPPKICLKAKSDCFKKNPRNLPSPKNKVHTQKQSNSKPCTKNHAMHGPASPLGSAPNPTQPNLPHSSRFMLLLITTYRQNACKNGNITHVWWYCLRQTPTQFRTNLLKCKFGLDLSYFNSRFDTSNANLAFEVTLKRQQSSFKENQHSEIW